MEIMMAVGEVAFETLKIIGKAFYWGCKLLWGGIKLVGKTVSKVSKGVGNAIKKRKAKVQEKGYSNNMYQDDRRFSNGNPEFYQQEKDVGSGFYNQVQNVQQKLNSRVSDKFKDTINNDSGFTPSRGYNHVKDTKEVNTNEDFERARKIVQEEKRRNE